MTETGESLSVIGAIILALWGAFVWGTYVARSDAQIMKRIAAEQCDPGQRTFIALDGDGVLCLSGMRGAHGR